MQSTKAVFISVVLALLMAPVVFYSAVLEHETETTWALSGVGSELNELGDKVNEQVNRQDRATANFIEKTAADLDRLNDFIDRLAEYEITPEEPSG